jgi:diaminopimelate epimerase
MGLQFKKMHGLGNDFVVIDGRGDNSAVSEATIRAMADRHRGIGYDQLAVLTDRAGMDVHLTFYNADGSPSATCGNATRCVAHLAHATSTTRRAPPRACARGAGCSPATDAERDGLTSASTWAQPDRPTGSDIPLARAVPISTAPADPGRSGRHIGMGNPHCVFVVADAETVRPWRRSAPRIERHPLLFQRAHECAGGPGPSIAPDTLRMRVWERGLGCDARVPGHRRLRGRGRDAHRRGLTGPLRVKVHGWMAGTLADGLA